MTIDVPEHLEEIIRRAVASGAFDSAEDAVGHALTLLEREQNRKKQQKEPIYDTLPDDLDPDVVARQQGIGPIQDPDKGAAESWPEDEDFDLWLSDLKELRGHGTPREIS